MTNDYILHARKIADGLLAEAREMPDGSLTWGRGGDRDKQPVIDSGLFNGRCGEAIFFAAVARATDESKFEAAALKALRGIRQGLEGASDLEAEFNKLMARLHLGVAGVGGMVYALVRIGQMLERDELIQGALKLGRFLTPERITADTTLDITWGTAGLLLSLLVLDEVGDDSALARAESCAHHLLGHRTLDQQSSCRAWATLKKLPSSGFAHGACGIAHALLRLHGRTDNQLYYDAALEAFSFERDLYRQDTDHWEEWREHTETSPRFRSWCHGAPGVALSRLSALDCLLPEHEKLIVGDLQLALRGTLGARTPTVDTICCGYFGRIDILLEAGSRLGNDSLIRQARKLADLRIQRAQEEGFHTAVSEEPTPLIGGLWQGQAGIGYTLLRLAQPDSFPCILSLG